MRRTLGFLSLIFICTAVFLPNILFAQVLENPTALQISSALQTSSIDLSIEEVSYDSVERELQLETIISNLSGNYIDGLNYIVQIYRGENLLPEGDIFGQLEYIYESEGELPILAPSVVYSESLSIKIPNNIPTGSYFVKLIAHNNNATDFGLTYTQEAITLNGDGTIRQFEDVYLSDQAGSKIPTPVISDEDLPKLNLVLPTGFTYNEEDKILIKFFSSKYDREFVGEISSELKDVAEFVEENNSISIPLTNKYFSSPGLYEMEVSLENKTDNVVFSRAKVPLVYDGDYTYVYDIEVPSIEFEAESSLPISIGIISNTFKPVSIRLEVVSQKGEEFSFTKDVTPEVGQVENYTFDELLDSAITAKEILVSVVDPSSGQVLDQHTISFPDADVDDGSFFGSGFGFVLKIIGIIVLIALIIFAVFYFIKKRKTTLASLVLIFGTAVTCLTFGHGNFVQAFETKVNLSVAETVTNAESPICPYKKEFYVAGSSRCPLDGTSVSGTVRLQTKNVNAGEWNFENEYAYAPSFASAKIFGPYIFSTTLDENNKTLSVRSEFSKSSEVRSLCVDEIKSYSEVSEVSCEVDICSNIDGAQLAVPRANDLYTSYGIEEKVTSLGMIQKNGQCYSQCSPNVLCGDRSECVLDQETGSSYCRPQLASLCETATSPDFEDKRDTFRTGERIFFRVKTVGGSADYEYNWTNVEDTVDDNVAFGSFANNGDYSANVRVTSGSLSTNVSCPVKIRECVQDSQCSLGSLCSPNGFCVSSLLKATCDAYEDPELTNKKFTTKINDPIYWGVKINGGEEPYAYSWSGDVSGNEKVVSRQYAQPGEKKATVNIIDSSSAKQNITVQCSIAISECTFGDNSTCSAGDICREDLLCGPPFPVINNFKIKGANLVSDGGTCSVDISARNVNKCTIINVTNGDRVSISANANSISEVFSVGAGDYYMECRNSNDDIKKSSKISCSRLSQSSAF